MRRGVVSWVKIGRGLSMSGLRLLATSTVKCFEDRRSGYWITDTGERLRTRPTALTMP